MSTELTFRQKLIRISCGAAVCGLSISFLLGEAVDTEARSLRNWQEDPRLVPTEYLPAQPLLSLLENVDTPAWKDNLVAVNSLIQSPLALDAGENRQLAEPELDSEKSVAGGNDQPRALDWLKTSDGAPMKFRIPERRIGSRAPLAPVKEARLKNTEVEVILASIHSATLKLTSKPASSPESTVAVNQEMKPKASPTPPSPPPWVSKDDLYIGSKVPTVPPKNALLAGRMVRDSSAPWILQGKIFTTTAHGLEPGHFEVGLYSKIDPDGRPIGYPFPQQILPSGQMSFRMEVPGRIEKGYLFAEFISAKTGKRTLAAPPSNPWLKGSGDVAELFFRADDSVTITAAAAVREPARDLWKISGNVTTMFTTGSASIPQDDVVIKVRGRKEAARTDRQGNFSLEIPRVKGVLFLEVLKAGYHPTIVNVAADESRPLHIEIASRHAIDQISQRLGANQGSSRGVLVGQALSSEGTPLRGMTAQVSIKADGPFYFDDEGVATRDAKATGANGRFIFFNVDSGTGYLETSLNGESIAPVQISSVDGGELIFKALQPVSGTLKGRVFNPVTGGKLAPVAGAKVRVDGASDWSASDSFGAFSVGPLKWIKGERIALELSAEKFNNHRYLVSVDQNSSGLNLFAFPAMYIARLARSMDVDLDPYTGVILGKVSGPSLRLDALADHSTVNNARDFYFDSKGRLRGSHEMTDSRFGTYIIFNVPKGRALLQGNDTGGVLRYSDSVFANPSSINVLMDN